MQNENELLARYDAALLEVEVSYCCGTEEEKAAAVAEGHAAWAALTDAQRAEITAQSDALDAMGPL